MIKKVIGTIFSRTLTAIITLLIVILSSNAFGPEGMGEISLIILSITIILLVSNFIGGGALVYLIPRHKITSVFFLCYVWAFASCIATTIVLFIFKLLPENYFFEILFLSILYSLTSINTTIFIARERINRANFITVLQIVTQIITLYFLLKIIGNNSIEQYVIALFVSWGLAFTISLIFLLPELNFRDTEPLKPLLKVSAKFGTYVQAANIIQLLNYRLSYYILNAFSGKSVLGTFSIGVQLSEGIWIVSKSLATVQYAKISNQNDLRKSTELTVLFLKASFILTFIGLLILILIPGNLYISVFGEGFISVKKTILLLSPGILAVACYSIFSHFFSGLGKYYINTFGSLIGFIFTIGGAFVLIPRFGLQGAAITATISYCATFIFQFILFFKISKAKPGDLIITLDNIRQFTKILRPGVN